MVQGIIPTYKCDVIENNICEIFNAILLKGRHKFIITLLKEMRLLVMKRVVDKKWFCKARFKGSLV